MLCYASCKCDEHDLPYHFLSLLVGKLSQLVSFGPWRLLHRSLGRHRSFLLVIAIVENICARGRGFTNIHLQQVLVLHASCCLWTVASKRTHAHLVIEQIVSCGHDEIPLGRQKACERCSLVKPAWKPTYSYTFVLFHFMPLQSGVWSQM